jgi:Dockerin type I domain
MPKQRFFLVLVVVLAFSASYLALGANDVKEANDPMSPQTRGTKANFIVTNTGDAGLGSLRDAMTQANVTGGTDLITFNIPGIGPHIIQPLSQLPILTDAAGVIIDGLSQPGAAAGANPPQTASLKIIIDGALAGNSHGLWIQSNGNTIRGLVISNFQGNGIYINGLPEAAVNTVYCNFIGTDVTGALDRGNGTNLVSLWAGVYIDNQPTGFAFNNTVIQNLISGNYAEGVAVIGPRQPGDVYGNRILHNLIGTDITGTVDLGNDHEGVCLAEGTHDNIVRGNLISGNDYDGVGIQGYNNLPYYPAPPIQTYLNIIDTNIIGADLTGNNPIPNNYHGVAIGEYGPTQWGCADRNRVGPSNRIFFNKHDGVAVWEDAINTSNADRNVISQNSIHYNNELGIDLGNDNVTPNDAGDPDTGPNQELNFPVITSAIYAVGTTTVTGTIDIDTPPNQAAVELFKAALDPTGYGEGETFISSTNPNATGNWTITTGTLAVGDYVTAVTIDKDGNTSEFSLGVIVTTQPVADTCEYYKSPYPDYAPFGMPDFDQKQNGWSGIPAGFWSYCGPVALANCFWWFDSKFETVPVPPPGISDHYPLVTDFTMLMTDDHSPNNVIPFVDSLALYSLCNPGTNGTFILNLVAGAQNWLNKVGLGASYTITLVPAPDFNIIKTEVMNSQDVILLLGFYENQGGPYCRLGGHYVTVAGVCTTADRFCISDPYFDNNEGEPPAGSAHPAAVHNDAQFISGPHGQIQHDSYNLIMNPIMVIPPPPMPPITELSDYPDYWNDIAGFWDMNYTDPPTPACPYMGGPIVTMIEWAIIICPIVCDCKPGDANGNSIINIQDITYVINYLYKGGPNPTPYKLCSGDPNGNCIVNIQDITYLINFLYKGGPAPVTCNQWLINCGSPLRK